jgi:uncharacterized sulfatase
MHNQYANPKYADVVSNLKRQLWQTREVLNETDGEYPHIQAIVEAQRQSAVTRSKP